VHTTCLQRWILTRPRSEHDQRDDTDLRTLTANRGRGLSTGDGTNDSRMICEICNQNYNIVVDYYFVFKWSRCLGGKSLGHCCEMILLIFILALCFSVVPLTKRVETSDSNMFGSSDADQIVWPIIECFLALIALFTMYKVYKRWRRANSELSVLPYILPPSPPTIDTRFTHSSVSYIPNTHHSSVSDSRGPLPPSSSFLNSQNNNKFQTAPLIQHNGILMSEVDGVFDGDIQGGSKNRAESIENNGFLRENSISLVEGGGSYVEIRVPREEADLESQS